MITAEDIKNTVNSVNYSISGIETILEQTDSVKSALTKYEQDLKDAETRVQFLSDTKGFYVKAVDLMYEESIGALKETLNTALQYVIADKNYACNLTLEDKRGTKNLYISLHDLDEDTEVDMKHGVGQGVRAVVGSILRIFYLINQSSPILLYDEKLAALSDQYIPRYFEFLHKLCEEKQLVLVLICHDPRFFDYADRTYLVNDGHIRLVGKDEDIGILEEEKED